LVGSEAALLMLATVRRNFNQPSYSEPSLAYFQELKMKTI